MKKLFLSAIAATLVVSPIALSAADAQGYRDRTQTTVRERPNGRTVVTQRTVRDNGNHAWRKGQRFDRQQARNYRQIDYRTYRGRGVYAPPRGYRWVQSGNDAVLVGITSGIIGAVIGNAIR